MINTAGKRKRAVARAAMKDGSGKVRINGTLLENHMPKMARIKIMEPIILVGDIAKKVDIEVKSHGGGVISQADAIRLAIGRAFIEKDESVEETLEGYDRKLIVADVRRKESRKPNTQGKARAKRQKSYR